jgi:CBS domain-containing protein
MMDVISKQVNRIGQEKSIMQARDIMSTAPVCVTPSTPLDEAARLMKDQDVGMLPVVDGDGSSRLVGVVTDRDITIRHVAEGHTKMCRVSEAMTKDVTTCRPTDDVDDVMKVMGSEQVRRIPIVDERGSLIGVVSQADIALRADDSKAAGRTVEEISQP